MSSNPSAPLDPSTLPSGLYQPESADFSVATLITELHAAFAGPAAAKGLSLEAESSPEFGYSDPQLVAQILKSLVSNAVKFTHTGAIRIGCRREPPSIRIEVSDSGVGMRAEQLAELFHAVPRAEPGEGRAVVGLAIVQRLVKLLNLRLDVTSEPGRGSVFSLRLPRGRAPRAAPADTVARPPEGVPPRVLLVEDDASVRDATRMLLRVEGYQVTAVADLAAAKRSLAEEGAPDLLLTDYHLRNGETGLTVIAALRAQLGAGLRTVLISGDAERALREVAGDARLRIATKPIRTEELLRLLRALLSE